MNAKLIPVAGALVVGLIGVAEACYYETSYVCKSEGTQIGYYAPSSGCSGVPVYTATDWMDWEDFYTSGGEVLDYDNPSYCEGPAYFTDCKSSQRVNLDTVTDSTTDASYRVAYGAGCY